jgi:hypothetical protein
VRRFPHSPIRWAAASREDGSTIIEELVGSLILAIDILTTT